MTREEALMLSAYTGVLLVPDFEDVHRYCEELMGFPILTHEFAEERLQIEIREKLRPRVWALCQTAADNPSSGREQVEKVFSGCDFCNMADFGEFGFEITKHYAKICCALGSWRFPQNEQFLFCPKCGKPLTDEAVDMVMERLEGMKDA